MNKNSVLRKTGVALAVVSTMVFEQAYAATFRVNSTIDQPGVCTFAAALAAVHRETPAGVARCSNTTNQPLGENDQITFSIGAITGISSPFEITRNVQINPGGNRVRFVGTGDSRIFNVDGSSGGTRTVVSMDNVELSNGNANGPGGAIDIRVSVDFTLSNSDVIDNVSMLDGGGIAVSQSTLIMQNSVVDNNTSQNGSGGGIAAFESVVNISGSVFSNNEAESFRLGNISVGRVAARTSDRPTPGNGGGISVVDPSGIRFTRILGTTFSGNSADEDGGAIYVQNGAQRRCGSDACVTLFNNIIIDNFSRRGGGISATEGGTIEILNTLVSRNQTSMHGGGVFIGGSVLASIMGSTISENNSDLGAGIAVLDNGVLEVINSTISGNIGSGRGAGILADANPEARISLIHSTISNNMSSGEGTGIFAFGNTLIEILNSVISGNTGLVNSFDSFQGVEINANNVLSAGVNVLGDNSISNDQAFRGFAPSSADITATSDGSQPTSIENILNPLANNGGRTPTHSLAEQSPAIDSADMTFCGERQITAIGTFASSDIDQTGKDRPIGPACDIGAFESEEIDSSNENEDANSFFVIPLANGKSVIIEL